MTGPQVLERAHTFLARHARLLLVVILADVVLASLVRAAHRAFWFDEIFTVAVTRLPSMAAVWGALHAATDTSPPGFYVLERALSPLVANEEIGFRLVSIVAVPLTSLFLYLFTRRSTDAVAASIAAVFPLLTVLYSTFSVEARPYATMACLLSAAAVAWQRARSPGWSIGFALLLAAAVSVHHYAVFALLPFAAAELTHTAFERKWRPGAWLALLGGGLAFAVYWPLLSRLRYIYADYYWAKASIVRTVGSYDEYMSIVTVGGMFGFAAVLSAALVVYVAGTLVPRPDDPIPPLVPPANCVLALGFLWLPWLALLVAKVGGGGIAARYTIGVALGLALSASYVASWLGRRASVLLLLCLLTAFGSQETVFWGAEWFGRNVRRVDVAGLERLLSRAPDPTLPVVVSNGREFVPLAYYAPAATSRRLVGLVDPEVARQQTGTDSIELDVLVLRRYLPIRVETYENFEAAHATFLLYTSPGHGEWWQARLLRDGFELRTLAAEGSRVLYDVSRATSDR